MNRTVELTNSFHNTVARVRPYRDKAGTEYLTKRQVDRARRTLCGIAECTCGDQAGCRPVQVQGLPDGDAIIL